MNTFSLKILAAERVFYDGACVSLTVPTLDGLYGVQARHEDAILAVVPGTLTVSRARKIQRFLAQPTFVAEKFTGLKGKYVPLSETLRGFEEILSGRMDAYPELAFYNVGTIDEALEKAKKLESGEL